MAETILSVFILSTGLLVIVKLMSSTLNVSFGSRDIIIATELAQEGVELVRNARDNDLAAGNKGFDRFPNSSHKHCRLYYNDDVTLDLNCDNSKGVLADYTLRYSGGRYVSGVAGTGKYYRYIYVFTNGGGDNQTALVRSFVFWGGRAGSATIDPNTIFGNGGDNIGTSGSKANCDLAHLCVFAETYLTVWKN